MSSINSTESKKLSDRIKTIRGSLSIKDFAALLGVTPAYIYDLEKGKKTKISDTLAELISTKFNISKHWLITGEGEMHAKPPIPEAIPLRTIPVLGRVPAGFPDQIPQQEIIEYISLPDIPAGSYGLIVKGDSMSPKIRDGDYVLFIPNGEFRNGDVVVVNNEWGESMVKRFREKDGEVMLTSDNPEYPSFKPNEHYRIMGKVVGVWRKVKL